MIFYTLRTILEKYEVEFKGEGTVYSHSEKVAGTITNASGYAITSQEELDYVLDTPYQLHDLDIGCFNLRCVRGLYEAYKKSGYKVELV